MIKVSVIIPVYNTELYVGKCLESIIGQTLKEIEIICVNDGSTDSSLRIIQKIAERDKRINVIHREKMGEYLWHAMWEFIRQKENILFLWIVMII